MKNIKIIILTILLLGFVSAYAQQTAMDSQKSNAVPYTEQIDRTDLTAGQPPAENPGEVPQSKQTVTKSTYSRETNTLAPGERNASMPPPESMGGNSTKEVRLPGQPMENSQNSGPTAGDIPNGKKPDTK